MPPSFVARAHDIAETVLFPAALEVDRTGCVPDSHWEAIAAAGLYGIAAPAELGGAGLDLPEILEILEVMASGCLPTAFAWVQHHGMLAGLSASSNTALREAVVPGAVAGTIRGGVAYAGAVPVPPRMRAERVEGGWRLSGYAPFVSGWGIVDLITFSAGDTATGDIVAGIADAREQPGIVAVRHQDLFVADASQTVSLDVEGLVIPDERIVSRVTRGEFMANQMIGSRFNATLPLGLVRRCIAELAAAQPDAAARLQTRAATVRDRLDAGLADPDVLLDARADACTLAVQAAATVIAAGGGPALLRSSTAQLLARSAAFTLVAASRPELKRALVSGLA